MSSDTWYFLVVNSAYRGWDFYIQFIEGMYRSQGTMSCRLQAVLSLIIIVVIENLFSDLIEMSFVIGKLVHL